MRDQVSETGYRKFVFFLGGAFVLTLGITLTLLWWAEVVAVFKGGIGLILALAGLLALYAAGKT